MNFKIFFVVFFAAVQAQAVAVIGHRGMGRDNPDIPENSIEGLTAALRGGADAVEFDVQLTADYEVVLLHDQTVGRATNGAGCVSKKRFADLRRLRLRDGSGRTHWDKQVPSFEEVLEAIRPYYDKKKDFLADVHLKVFAGARGDWGGVNFCPRTDYRMLAWRVMKTLKEKGMAGKVILTAFHAKTLDYARLFDEHVKTGLLTFLNTKAHTDLAAKKGYDAIVMNWNNASRLDFAYARARRLMVLAWFSDSGNIPSKDTLEGYAIDGVITDMP
ncbi:MAG: hypothetical protein A2583_04505 [Bdellovibrionales bacterium RIFOXYD1_FULL_53_11]|nr:MAG: hypothetical protein A2583_04505 [Bdellovibrionales bacterium RIFOXYD1_FULL_53_11]